MDLTESAIPHLQKRSHCQTRILTRAQELVPSICPRIIKVGREGILSGRQKPTMQVRSLEIIVVVALFLAICKPQNPPEPRQVPLDQAQMCTIKRFIPRRGIHSRVQLGGTVLLMFNNQHPNQHKAQKETAPILQTVSFSSCSLLFSLRKSIIG